MSRHGRKEADRRRPRIALFTHDTFGLGHVRRSTHILRALSERLPDASLLLVTGSPALHRLPSLPPNVDFVKIPTIVKTGGGHQDPSHLHLPVQETTELRKRLIRETVLGFAPDVFVVDNFPLGSRKELLPTLEALRALPTRTVLGLRDILDDPEVVKTSWQREGMYEILGDLYDEILVYGVRRLFDVAKAYALPDKTAGKLTYCGYVTDPHAVEGSPARLRRTLGVRKPFFFVTGGGGGDAYPLLKTFLEAAPELPGCSALLLTGPLMGAKDQRKLRACLNGNHRIQMKEFVPDVRAYVQAADVVVSMCGYNSAAEIMSLAPRALVVPRTWQYGEHARRNEVRSEGEQRIRAEAFARRGLVHTLSPEDLTPERLALELRRTLRAPRPEPGKRPSVQGVRNAARHLARLVTA